MIKYDTYVFSLKDWGLSILIWILICIIPSYFFYRSYIALLIFLLFYPVFFLFYRRDRKEKRRQTVMLQFLEMIRSLAVNLQTGSNLDNAFRKTVADMEQELGANALLTKELIYIRKGLDNNEILEQMLAEFAERTGIEAMEEFVFAYGVGRRSGANMQELIQSTYEDMSERMNIWKERKILIASQEMELKIMSVIPFGIMAYIGFTNPGYFDFFYHNVTGILIMTGCLIMYLGAIFWGVNLISPGKGRYV